MNKNFILSGKMKNYFIMAMAIAAHLSMGYAVAQPQTATTTPVCPPAGVLAFYKVERTSAFDSAVKSRGAMPDAPGICEFESTGGEISHLAGGLVTLEGDYDARAIWAKMKDLFPLAPGKAVTLANGEFKPDDHGLPGPPIHVEVGILVRGSGAYEIDGATRPTWVVGVNSSFSHEEQVIQASNYDVQVDKKTGLVLSMQSRSGTNFLDVCTSAKQLRIPGEASFEQPAGSFGASPGCNSQDKITDFKKDAPPDIFPDGFSLKYPGIARMSGLSGVVHVDFEIDPSGTVTCANVHRFQRGTHPLLQQAAVLSVLDTKFKPYRVHEVPTSGRFVLPIRYVLE